VPGQRRSIPGNPIGSNEPWVVALGRVVDGESGAPLIELQRGGVRLGVPRDLIQVRNRFVTPVIESYANEIVQAHYPDDKLAAFIALQLIWRSPPRPYELKDINSMLASLRLVAHGGSPRQGPSGAGWLITDDLGRPQPATNFNDGDTEPHASCRCRRQAAAHAP
jgi:hypothetical protein